VVFDPAPPYRVKRTASFSEEQLLQTLFAAEDALGRRLDEWPRPHLVQGGLDGFANEQLPGPRHAALWFDAPELSEERVQRALAAIDRRLKLDPYATLDVVLRAPRVEQRLVQRIRALFEDAPQSYLSRSLAHRGEDAQRRIAVVLPPGAAAQQLEGAQVFREVSAEEAVKDPEGVRIIGPATNAQLDQLAREADMDLITFADETLERAWQDRILGQ
jgi:hypothetical protein